MAITPAPASFPSATCRPASWSRTTSAALFSFRIAFFSYRLSSAFTGNVLPFLPTIAHTSSTTFSWDGCRRNILIEKVLHVSPALGSCMYHSAEPSIALAIANEWNL
jgi:hypothetical protein